MGDKWIELTIENTHVMNGSITLYHPPSKYSATTIKSNLDSVLNFQRDDPQFDGIQVSANDANDQYLKRMTKVVIENTDKKPIDPGSVVHYKMELYHRQVLYLSQLERRISLKVLILPDDSPLQITATKTEEDT